MKLTQLTKLTIAPVLAGNLALAAPQAPASGGTVYPDGRPSATLRLEATDQGVVLKHGDRPGHCDILGAREALIFEGKGIYHHSDDGAGPKGWLALAGAVRVGDDLAGTFAAPPVESRAWCYWWWLNGNASKEGITRDCEEMRRKGISGALLFDAGYLAGDPQVPQPYDPAGRQCRPYLWQTGLPGGGVNLENRYDVNSGRNTEQTLLRPAGGGGRI